MRKKLNIGRDLESRRKIEKGAARKVEAPKSKPVAAQQTLKTDETKKKEETPSDTPAPGIGDGAKKTGGREAKGDK